MGQRNGKGIPQALESQNGFYIQDGSLLNSDYQSEFEQANNLPTDMIYSSDQKGVTLDDFELLKVIGRGNFAKVMQVRKKDNGKVRILCSYLTR
jgi:hypothetical protein